MKKTTSLEQFESPSWGNSFYSRYIIPAPAPPNVSKFHGREILHPAIDRQIPTSPEKIAAPPLRYYKHQ